MSKRTSRGKSGRAVRQSPLPAAFQRLPCKGNSACREARHAAKGATLRLADASSARFPLWNVRVAAPASCGAPWTALAFCDRCPCSASLHPPQAALGSAALRQNFTANRALGAQLLAHNLPQNFPVGVAVVGALRPQARFGGQPGRKARLLGRRLSADGDDFRLFRQSEAGTAGRCAGLVAPCPVLPSRRPDAIMSVQRGRLCGRACAVRYLCLPYSRGKDARLACGIRAERKNKVSCPTKPKRPAPG